jgi:hypothetical protein
MTAQTLLSPFSAAQIDPTKIATGSNNVSASTINIPSSVNSNDKFSDFDSVMSKKADETNSILTQILRAVTSPSSSITPNNDYWDIYPSSFSSVLPTDTLSWLEGDNRNEQLKACLIDIALYHLHSRINPRNIPELRKERYDGNSPEQKGGAIGWLKNVAHGLVNADLPEKIDFQLPISWGSYEKQNNNF